MIKRRRMSTINQGDCGLFFQQDNDPVPVDGWVPYFKTVNGELIVIEGNDMDGEKFLASTFVYWVSFEDIYNAISEEYV